MAGLLRRVFDDDASQHFFEVTPEPAIAGIALGRLVSRWHLQRVERKLFCIASSHVLWPGSFLISSGQPASLTSMLTRLQALTVLSVDDCVRRDAMLTTTVRLTSFSGRPRLWYGNVWELASVPLPSTVSTAFIEIEGGELSIRQRLVATGMMKTQSQQSKEVRTSSRALLSRTSKP